MNDIHPEVKIIIAAHKSYRMPADQMYLPLHVGAEGKKDEQGNILDLGYVKDNTGDNISEKNPSYCELTGLYWAWKNLDADYIGLVHYRRHFSLKKKGQDVFGSILTEEELRQFIPRYKIFVPKKRNYYIETLYSHYSHTHYAEHLDLTRQIISEECPEYLDSFDKVMKSTGGYMFNMMIMRKELLSSYCEWLFGILFKLESRMETPELSDYQGRFYGRVSEIIFNVWLDYQLKTGKTAASDIKELPYIYTEQIRWGKKIISFLQAKFMKKKYEGSF